MKNKSWKFITIIFAILLLVSCSSSSSRTVKKAKKRFKNLTEKYSEVKRFKSKFSSQTKPSEVAIVKVSHVEKKREQNSEIVDDYVAPEEEIPAVKTSRKNDDTPKYEMPDDGKNYSGYFKVGNPYEVFGVSYVPQNYEDYEETGTSSWYGDDFHGKKTANGETYDMRDMTAAHPTLPLPSLVRVTNLRNGKKVIVRVNDRGPFAKNRIIDVSEKAAEALDFKRYGTTEVKIELLREDTDDMLHKLKISPENQ